MAPSPRWEAHEGDWSTTVTFEDAAVSGATMQRSGIQALRSVVLRAFPEFDVIVVESVDRISRDMADAARFFQELAFHGVRLIAVSDGIHTAEPSARLTFGLRAVVADQYVADLGAKTLRGLRGRAAQGCSTGAVPYGYVSIRNVDANGKSTGSTIAIDVGEAVVVRRIFELWVGGVSCLGITERLNADGLPTPRGARKRNGRGWVDTTVRAVLRNAAYVGRWTYGEKHWLRVPGTKKRRPRQMPDEKVQRFERPHLRIVPLDTWKAAQTRIQETKGRLNGRSRTAAPVAKTRYPLSGLLYCASCGEPP